MALPVVPIFAALGVVLTETSCLAFGRLVSKITKTLVLGTGVIALKSVFLKVLSFVSGQAFPFLYFAYNLGKPIIQLSF